MSKTSRGGWLVPALMAALSLVPIAAGASRMIELSEAATDPSSTGAQYSGDDAPLLIHILSGVIFALMVAYQTAPGPRVRHPMGHRILGRVAVSLGMIASATGVWLIVGYPMSQMATALGNAVRVTFAVALAFSIMLAVVSIRRRQTLKHRFWMIRAFAIAIAGSTQAVLIGGWSALIGEPRRDTIALLLTLGFAINSLIAEFRIQQIFRQSKQPQSFQDRKVME